MPVLDESGETGQDSIVNLTIDFGVYIRYSECVFVTFEETEFILGKLREESACFQMRHY